MKAIIFTVGLALTFSLAASAQTITGKVVKPKPATGYTLNNTMVSGYKQAPRTNPSLRTRGNRLRNR